MLFRTTLYCFAHSVYRSTECAKQLSVSFSMNVLIVHRLRLNEVCRIHLLYTESVDVTQSTNVSFSLHAVSTLPTCYQDVLLLKQNMWCAKLAHP